jgi:hypothetical protein
MVAAFLVCVLLLQMLGCNSQGRSLRGARRIRRIVWLTSVVVSVPSVVVLLVIWRYSFSPWRDIQTELF